MGDECGRGGIPGAVSASLERIADTAVGEARSVGFLLDEELSGELFDYTSFAVLFDEGIVFFGRAAGQGLEPVSIVCSTLILSIIHI